MGRPSRNHKVVDHKRASSFQLHTCTVMHASTRTTAELELRIRWATNERCMRGLFSIVGGYGKIRILYALINTRSDVRAQAPEFAIRPNRIQLDVFFYLSRYIVFVCGTHRPMLRTRTDYWPNGPPRRIAIKRWNQIAAVATSTEAWNSPHSFSVPVRIIRLLLDIFHLFE